MHPLNRRTFLAHGSLVSMALLSGCGKTAATKSESELFKISLAQWSLHKSFFGEDGMKFRSAGPWEDYVARLRADTDSMLTGPLDPLDFPVIAKRDYGIDAVEYVNVFYFDKARNDAYLKDLKARADGEGVYSHLIMCDSEGRLGDPDDGMRRQAVENHQKWADMAAFLGCASIRVNAASEGSYDEQMKFAADGLNQLADYAEQYGLNVIVENHGGLSSNGAWLSGVMRMADNPRIGTLPDFGNFKISDTETYDVYQGVEEMMPFAKGVSAKTYGFTDQGEESSLDYKRLMKIVLDAGFRGYLGVEFEGDGLSEHDGIFKTKALLEKLRDELAPQYA